LNTPWTKETNSLIESSRASWKKSPTRTIQARKIAERKTTTLATGSAVAGYQVEVSPTSLPLSSLKSWHRSSTLQLLSQSTGGRRKRHLYFVDESSLATRRGNEFLHRLHDRDRVIFVANPAAPGGGSSRPLAMQKQDANGKVDEIIGRKIRAQGSG